MKEMFTLFAMAIAIINALGYASAQEADTTPPTVVKVSPPNGATDVKPGITTISVTFSEEMMGGYSWMVMGHKGLFPTRVDGPKYDETHTTCSISALLLPGTTYAIGINYEGGGNFKDKSGNPAVSFEDWVFTTSGTKEEIPAFLAKMVEDKDSNVREVAARELKRLTDTTPPTVVKVYPQNGATDVKPGITTISVTFSEEMMAGGWSWWELSDLGEGPFPSVITGPRYDESRTTCFMSVLLSPGTTYAIGINSPEGGGNFKDESGKSAAFYKWVFTTSGTKEEIPAFLAEMLEDEDSNVRRIVARELKRLKDKRAIEPLTKALEDEDLQVRRIASAALAELGVDVDKPRISVKVDPRVELISIVISMTDWGEKHHTRLQFAYRDEVKAWFSPYREHEAVKMASQLINSGFSFDAPMGFILYHSSPPELKQLQPYSEYHITRAGGDKKRLEEFAESLRKFARDAKFEEFWKNHRDFYSEIEAEINPAISDKGIAEKLEHYYGVKQNSYAMIPAPLIMGGGYGASIRAENGKLDIYEIFGPGNVKDGKPLFGSGENLAGLALHEFGHSFVGPVTEEFSERLDEFKELYEPIRDDMQSQAYGMWKAAVDEHLLRAIQARFILAEKGEAAAKGNLVQEYSRGFKYVKHLYNLLPAYEQNREKYPTFEFFFPLVLNLFAELKRSKIVEKLADEPFSGVINNAWSRRYLEKAIIIKPSKNKNPEVAKQVDDYIQSFQTLLKERMGVNVPILSDEEGLKTNLSEHAFVVFGAPWNNAFLAEILKDTPIEVTEKNIKIGSKSFEGENLRLITVWTNPQNKKLPIVIYTATSDAGIVNINKLFHGPTDYVIYGGDGTKLQDGFYEKDESGPWTVGLGGKDMSGEMLSLEERLKNLNALCDAIERIHPSLEYKGVKMEILRKEFEERVKNVKDNDKFYNLLKELLERIHDSHTRLVSIPGKEEAAIPPSPKIEELISYRWLENKIGYIKIRAFWGGMGEEGVEKFVKRFDEALEEFKESRALVIDVRGNGGGSDGLADMVNGRFIKEPVIDSISFWREEGTDRYEKGVGFVMPRGPWTYEKPVAVLIDKGCASACEHLVAGAEATGRMLLVGTPTAGAGGGPTQVTLPSGAVVSISRAISIRTSGIVFEGHGIPPHIEVPSDSEKMKAGVDTVLEEALKAVEEWIKKGDMSLPQRHQVIALPPPQNR